MEEHGFKCRKLWCRKLIWARGKRALSGHGFIRANQSVWFSRL